MTSNYSAPPSPPPKRVLTSQEKAVLNILDYVEDLTEKRKLFGSLVLNETALDLVQRHGVAVPAAVTKDRKQEVFHVRFHLPELVRYINFACATVGFTVNLDGSVKTRDGIQINRLWKA